MFCPKEESQVTCEQTIAEWRSTILNSRPFHAPTWAAKLVFAIDVATIDMVAAVAAADGRVLHTICWKAPE
jgi:hypothetical protein